MLAPARMALALGIHRDGKALGGGSDGVAGVSPRDASSSISGHPIVIRSQEAPVLALDMYEHFITSTSVPGREYVDTFMSVIRWPAVDRIFGELHTRRRT
jgi:superoxide dismutase